MHGFQRFFDGDQESKSANCDWVDYHHEWHLRNALVDHLKRREKAIGLCTQTATEKFVIINGTPNKLKLLSLSRCGYTITVYFILILGDSNVSVVEEEMSLLH